MNIIYSKIKHFLQYISNRKVRELRKAKKLCQFLAETQNQRHWVLPDWTGKLRVVNRETIKLLKKKGILAKGVNSYNLEKEALFIADPPALERRKHIFIN